MPNFSKTGSKPLKKIEKSVDFLSPLYFPPPDDRMRQREVASMFDTTVQTIINWRKAGKIPTFHIGKTPIFSRKLLIYCARQNKELIKK